MVRAVADLSRSELESRLSEAEETLRAIREGEVDALVVKSSTAEQVFVLEGGTQSYRTFMETMDIGAAVFDDDGRLIYTNPALCTLLDQTPSDLRDQGLADLADPVGQAALRRLTTLGKVGKQSAEVHLRVRDVSKTLHLTATPVELGTTHGIAVTFTDLSEREQSAAAMESERLARAILASANEAVVVCDREGKVTHVNAAGLKICNSAPVGQKFEDAVSLSFADSTGLISGADITLMAIGGAPVQGIEAAVIADASNVTDMHVSAAPLIVAGDRIQGCVITLINLTQRKAAERQRELLMGELDHRVKNTLAMVLAISARTAAREQSLEDFQRSFSGRIQALAATHTLLSEASWQNLQIEDVLRAELEPFASASSGRVLTSGLNVAVDARTSVSLGLIFHELTTNAVKYGALSTQKGSLSVRAVGRSGTGKLIIRWEETGGPIVTAPAKAGFGHTLISRSLGDGESGTKLEFLPGGVVCEMIVPD